MSSPSAAFVLGTRPELIKLAPILREAGRRGLDFTIVHTGQHYSEELSDVFIDQLELPRPTYNLGVGSGTHGEQTGAMIMRVESALLELEPDVVLVQGDTNSVLAGAIVTSKLAASLAHVEAGLRSFDRRMPEEINRIVADHLADYLFAPTETAAKYLRDEGCHEDRLHVTGNTIVDAVYQHRDIAREKSSVEDDLGLEADSGYAVLTVHRAENVDDPRRFSDILDGVGQAGKHLGLEVIYPVHPRAADRLQALDVDVPEAVRMIDPLAYLDFLALQAGADLVLTDSGGIQEEACILEVPCVTLRESTERPETLEIGVNRLVGTDPDAIVNGAVAMAAATLVWENPYGNGEAATKILDVLENGPLAD